MHIEHCWKRDYTRTNRPNVYFSDWIADFPSLSGISQHHHRQPVKIMHILIHTMRFLLFFLRIYFVLLLPLSLFLPLHCMIQFPSLWRLCACCLLWLLLFWSHDHMHNDERLKSLLDLFGDNKTTDSALSLFAPANEIERSQWRIRKRKYCAKKENASGIAGHS